MYILHNLMDRAEEIRSHAGGSAYKEISRGRFGNLMIIMPPLALCNEFNETASLLLEQMRSLLRENDNLVRARDLLLRLMNGEIKL